MFQLAIVADDLTGAMDSGVQFAKRGLRTVVSLADTLPAEAAGADVVVLNTNSRPDAPAEARRKVLAAGHYLRQLGVPRVYKKIDSTLRGNVGVELAALREAWDAPCLVMTPAFPAVGRTVVAGLLFVNGVPWDKTQYNEGTSFATSAVAEVIGAGDTAATLELVDIHRGATFVAARLRDLCLAGKRLIVADANTSAELAILADGLVAAGLDHFVCGSGGLAEELPRALGLVGSARGARAATATGAPPVFVVAGTVNTVTVAQVRLAHDTLSAAVLELLPESLAADPQGEVQRMAAASRQALANGTDLIVATVPLTSPAATMTARDSAVATALGPIVAAGLRPGDWSGVVMTGGDTAVSLLAAIGVGALEIMGEVEPGVPCGLLLEGPLAGLAVVTKAGGFGSPEAIVKAVKFLRGRASQ